jgi:gluconolactonase
MPASLAIAMIACTGSSPDDQWQDVNKQLIEKHSLKATELSGLPTTNIKSNLAPGKIQRVDGLDSTELHPGVSGKFMWGSGAMITILQFNPDAKIPEETIPADRFLFVLDGSVEHEIDGSPVTLISEQREAPDGTHGGTPRTDFVFLEKGSKVAVSAGPAGARLLEVYSPLRLDYLQKAGVDNLPNEVVDIESKQTPNVQPGKVYDLYDFQPTEIDAGTHSRLIAGKNMLIGFTNMDPGASFSPGIHPEEQLSLALRGDRKSTILDEEVTFKTGDIVRIPSNMVHGASVGDLGSDVLDVFWPGRQDYLEKEKTRMAEYHAIIPEDAKPELLVDGKQTEPELFFSEGPKWLKGKVYFSNMYFDQNFGADPKRSSIIELDPSGTYKAITQGKMQANGLYPLKNGNLLVCDMMGHRVVEMTTKGQVVRVVADKYNGKFIDGPNDVVTDAKGGFYFTDPQFTMESEKFQPGRAVYYVSREGKVTRIVEPNEFAMPNGIVLTPDGKTLYINNCYDDEDWFPVKSEKDNFVWAYDVNDDGTISSGRKFAKLFLPGEVLDRKGRSSSADGMAIDKAGNLYVATYLGVQIFNASGEFVGMINLPSFPVSLCFGDEDMKTLYIVSFSKVYRIKTNMEGYLNGK